MGNGNARGVLLVTAAIAVLCAAGCPAQSATDPGSERTGGPALDADAPLGTDAGAMAGSDAGALDPGAGMLVDDASASTRDDANAPHDAAASADEVIASASDAGVADAQLDAAGEGASEPAPDASAPQQDAALDEPDAATDPEPPAPQTCPDGSAPSRELCDDVDNDCDGAIDEGSNPCGGVCFLDDEPGAACDGPDADSCVDDVIECDGRNATRCSMGDEGGICSQADTMPRLVERADAAGLVASFVPHPAVPVSIAYWSGGIAIGDFDRDGDPDVFMVSGGTRPDYLFINQGDGSFVDEALAWGLSAVHAGNGATAGDYDGDGLIDLYVTSFGPDGAVGTPGHNRLYRNLGGSFDEVALAAGVATVSSTSPWSTGAAFGDYDRDGDLDLAVSTYAARAGGTRLFRNDGDGTFSDVTAAAIGEEALSAVLGFSPRFTDMDGDGYPELLLTGDYGTSRYLKNQGDGSFVDITQQAGLGLDGYGMGHTVLDFDGDGRLDWYVTSLYWSSGWTLPGKLNGNVLYRQLAPHTFGEVAAQSGTQDGGAAWGAIAVDLDQDGREEIVSVAQGEQLGYTRLFHNRGGALFGEVHAAAGLDARDGRNVVVLDADLDGDQDLLITRNGSMLTAVPTGDETQDEMIRRGRLAYYRNDSVQAGGFLQVVLDAHGNPELAPDGHGARIEARFGGTTLVRVMDASPSFLGSSELVAHFGLGGAAIVPELRIRWGSGYETVLRDVAANQRVVVTAPPAREGPTP